MGISILYDRNEGKAVLVCNTEDWSLSAPVAEDCAVCGMGADDVLDEFLVWCEGNQEVRDIRMVGEVGLDRLWQAYNVLHNLHICRDCAGTGRIPFGDKHEITCGACEGAGKLGGKTHEDEAVERATGEVIR